MLILVVTRGKLIMKRSILHTCTGILGAVALSGAALAKDGYTGPDDATAATAAEVAGLKDDTHVRMVGRLVRSLGDETYEFEDDTGMLIVEIDDEVWQGESFGSDILVELTGEIDNDDGRPELDVDHIRASTD
jgi:uncharacterized protein (TIGR00156 family)